MQALGTSEQVRMVPSAKRVRTYLGGVVVADSIHPMLVWEDRPYPAYYIPAADVRMELLAREGEVRNSPEWGDGRLYTVRAGGRAAPGAALRYEDSPVTELRDLIRFEWSSMDSWFEEDEEVFTHPRSPYARIDILASSRHVQVEVDGVTVADTSSPRLLFETGLPVRYYIPKPHLHMEHLVRSDGVSSCPYKGQAEYWSVQTGESVHADIAWSYRSPLPESQKIAGLVAFYNEKVDIYVDGVLQERPITHFR